jgi:hypothetical protein
MLLESSKWLTEGRDDRYDVHIDAPLYLLVVNFQVFHCLQSKWHNGFKNVFVFNKSHGILCVYTSKRLAITFMCWFYVAEHEISKSFISKDLIHSWSVNKYSHDFIISTKYRYIGLEMVHKMAFFVVACRVRVMRGTKKQNFLLPLAVVVFHKIR